MSARARNVVNSWQDKPPFVRRPFFLRGGGVWGGGCSGGKEKRRQIGSGPFRSLCCLKWNQFPEFLKGERKRRERSGGLLQVHKTFQSFFVFTVLGALWGLYWELSQYLSRSNSLHTRKYRFIIIVIVLLPNIATQTIKKIVFYSNTCLQ